jgi:hypothetical protein
MCWWNLAWDTTSQALLIAFRHGFIATPAVAMFDDVGRGQRARWLMIRVRRTLFTIRGMGDISGDSQTNTGRTAQTTSTEPQLSNLKCESPTRPSGDPIPLRANESAWDW